MYKKVSVVLGTLALMVAIGFGTSQSYAGEASAVICHVPPGNPGNMRTISVRESAVQTHLEHGDLEGACESP